MKTYVKKWSLLIALLLSVAPSLLLAGSEETALSDQKAVNTADKQFYTALNAMFRGKAVPIEKIWSHSSDDVYMGPAGFVTVGWKTIFNAWKKEIAMKVGVKVTPHRIKMTVEKELAVIQNREEGDNRNSQGKLQPAFLFREGV